MKFFTYTEAGSHQENEDNLALISHPENNDILISVLCDGQGGQPGGAMASKYTVKFCLDVASKTQHLELFNPFNWVELGEAIDKKILELQGAGLTTFIGLIIGNGFVTGASCGDSAALLLLDNKIAVLTAGQKKHPAVGSSGASLQPFSAKLEGDWKLLLMSDGVWKFIDWMEMENCIREYSENDLILKLKEMVINRFHELPDDFSIVLIES